MLGVGDEQADEVAPAAGDGAHGLGVVGVDPAGVERHREQLVADALVDVAVDVDDDGLEGGGLGEERGGRGDRSHRWLLGSGAASAAPGRCGSCHHLPGVPGRPLPKGA